MADSLSAADASAFLRLWSCLDAYVNASAHVLPAEHPPEVMRGLPPSDLARVRQALWSAPHLIDEFVRENPSSLPAEELAEVLRLKESVRGTFYVERYLKDGAALVGVGKDAAVYLVHGITESVQDLLWRALPGGQARLVDATLVPFRGRVVWDGIVRMLPVTFGATTRKSFSDCYRRAKERGQIIVSLDGGPKTLPKPRRSQTDWRPAVHALAVGAEALGKPATTLQGAAFRLLKHTATLAEASLAEPADIEQLVEQIRKAQRSLNQVISALDLVE